ncbi:MAG: Mrp/NBP35 family ATP-binding protein [Clostridia bacterium]|nr:Mrp/NBP35 family ATP-binding protein [Clostridia bacterium]
MSDKCNNNCAECGEDCAERREKQSFLEAPNASTHVGKMIGVVSGKGGVGKSLVTSLLASAMRKQGFETAVLDADITGPSIPKILGIKNRAYSDGEGIYPVSSQSEIKVMSINLLLESETDPVVWRGPIIAGAVKQFWTDIIWGDVDYMFVDMPPGTGDVPLTVFQSLPVDGIIIVASPQQLVEMIVSKAFKMAETMNIPVLGLVENMSYYVCPNCGEKHYIFGDSKIEELAEKFGVAATARIPIDEKLAALCDSGNIESLEQSWTDAIISAVKEAPARFSGTESATLS